MNGAFNFAVVEMAARRAGISFREMCRRAQRSSTAAKRRRKRDEARAADVRAKRWDLRNED